MRTAVRLCLLAALIAGPVCLPKRSQAEVPLPTVTIPSVTSPADINTVYPDGYWTYLGHGFEIVYLSQTEVTGYLSGVTSAEAEVAWQKTLDGLQGVLKDPVQGPKELAVINGAKTWLGAHLVSSVQGLLYGLVDVDTILLDVQSADGLAYLNRGGVVAILTYDRVPLCAFAFALGPGHPPIGTPGPGINLTTTHGCGGSFAGNETVVAIATVPFSGTIRVTVGSRDAPGEYPLVSNLQVKPDTPVALSVPAGLHQIFPNAPDDFWRVRLYPTTAAGLSLPPTICNFSITPFSGSATGGGSGGGGSSGSAPTAPIGLQVAGVETDFPNVGVRIQWNDPYEQNGDSYVIQGQDDNSSAWKDIGTAGSFSSSYFVPKYANVNIPPGLPPVSIAPPLSPRSIRVGAVGHGEDPYRFSNTVEIDWSQVPSLPH